MRIAHRGSAGAAFFIAAVFVGAGCATAAEPCSVSQNEDGSATITCPDGTSARVEGGRDGHGCSIAETGDDVRTITCSDGTQATIRDGETGQAGSACSVTQHEDGSVTIGCEDGSSATFAGALGGTLQGDYTIGNGLDALLLAGFTELTGTLVVDAPSLTTLGALALTRIGGALRVEGQTALTGVTGLSNLTAIGGNLSIGDNAALESLAGLDALTTIGGDLLLGENPLLEDLAGLGSLAQVEGNVLIGSRPMFAASPTSLRRLDGLENLTSIGASLLISDNPVLASLAALDGLQALGTADPNPFTGSAGALYVVENPQLPECQALALRDRLIGLGFEGEVVISGNDTAAICP